MTAEQIDYATGEVITADLVPFQASTELDRSAEGVVAILTHARQWLASAVDMTGPAEIAQAKAVIATAETYAKELHLSKEIQMDATEMVRRAEYALGKAIRKGQAEGTVAKREDNRHSVRKVDTSSYTRPTDYASPDELHGNGAGIYRMVDDTTDDQFEDAITEAKAEGNLSRANVVRKVKGEPTPLSRKEKAEKARRLAGEGYTSRQIAMELKIGPEGFRALRNDFDIDVPADRIMAGRRHIDTNRIVGNTVTALEGIALSLDLINPDDIDPREAQKWADSLTQSLEALRKLNRQIKESIQ